MDARGSDRKWDSPGSGPRAAPPPVPGGGAPSEAPPTEKGSGPTQDGPELLRPRRELRLSRRPAPAWRGQTVRGGTSVQQGDGPHTHCSLSLGPEHRRGGAAAGAAARLGQIEDYSGLLVPPRDQDEQRTEGHLSGHAPAQRAAPLQLDHEDTHHVTSDPAHHTAGACAERPGAEVHHGSWRRLDGSERPAESDTGGRTLKPVHHFTWSLPGRQQPSS